MFPPGIILVMIQMKSKRTQLLQTRGVQAVVMGALAGFLAIALCCPCGAVFAETQDINAEANGLQKTVESTAAEYNRATERVDEIASQIEENEAQIEALDGQIPGQREACAVSMASLYKLHRSNTGILSVILSSQDFSSFISTFDYFNRIHETATNKLENLSQMLAEREAAQGALEEARFDAEQAQETAKRAALLAAAQREAAQKAAEEKAQQEARERKAAEEAQQTQGTASSAEESLTTPSTDGADWSKDKSTFVKSWAGRLDAYLAGSPLSGQGKTFASAAWDAGIDPRFSAAISDVESSKGAACFRPCNAWGWGSSSWGSWEEAIPAHAVGLARGYGYTVSEAAAQKYCPGNWEHWYNRVSEEMAKI